MLTELLMEIEVCKRRLMAYKKRPAAMVAAEAKLNTRLDALFSGIFEDVVREFQAIGRVPADAQTRRQIVRFFTEARDELITVVADETAVAAQHGRNKIISHMQRQGIAIRFDDVPRGIIDAIRERTFVPLTATMKRVTQNVMDILADCYEKGMGVFDTAQELKKTFTTISNRDLRTIARTEIQCTQNHASYLTQQEIGVDFHMWITAEDDRVRGHKPEDEADHTIMHGQIVRVGDKFSNGLLYPGDRTGEIEEWINCRCHDVPFFMPEGYMAPAGAATFTAGDIIKKEGG